MILKSAILHDEYLNVCSRCMLVKYTIKTSQGYFSVSMDSLFCCDVCFVNTYGPQK